MLARAERGAGREGQKPRGRVELNGPAAQAAREKAEALAAKRREMREQTARNLTPPRWVAEGEEPMAELVDVASGFGVEHRKARLKVEQLIEWEPNLRSDTFIRTSMLVHMPNGGTRSEDSYKMTHGGFMRLVTQFEGEKPAKVIGAWVDDYQRMKAMLKRGGGQGPRRSGCRCRRGADPAPGGAGGGQNGAGRQRGRASPIPNATDRETAGATTAPIPSAS